MKCDLAFNLTDLSDKLLKILQVPTNNPCFNDYTWHCHKVAITFNLIANS